MLSSSVIYGSAVAMLTACGVSKYCWNKKNEDVWWGRLSSGVKDDSRTLWRSLIGRRTQKDIEWEKFTINDVDYKSFVKRRTQLEETFNDLNDELRKKLQVTKEESSEQVQKLVSDIDEARLSLIDWTNKIQDYIHKSGFQDFKEQVVGLTNDVAKNVPTNGRGKKIDSIAASGLAGWGENAAEFAKEELEEESETRPYKKPSWFGKKGKSSSKLNENDLAKTTMEHLEGWGENAAEFAKDEYEELLNNKKS